MDSVAISNFGEGVSVDVGGVCMGDFGGGRYFVFCDFVSSLEGGLAFWVLPFRSIEKLK